MNRISQMEAPAFCLTFASLSVFGGSHRGSGSIHQHQHGGLLGEPHHVLELPLLRFRSLSLATTSGRWFLKRPEGCAPAHKLRSHAPDKSHNPSSCSIAPCSGPVPTLIVNAFLTFSPARITATNYLTPPCQTSNHLQRRAQINAV